MMYSNKFVATIKTKGKVLREVKDTVYLPFGSEYSILLKNLNTVRAQVRITIDDEDVLNGSSLIIHPNDDLEIERFLKDLNKGNRFKFIERTSQIEQHRGVGAADGIVRIEWQFEKVYQPVTWPNNNIVFGNVYTSAGYATNASKGVLRSSSAGGQSSQLMNMAVSDSITCSVSACSTETYDSYTPQSDVGITVPGSISEQKFTQGSWFAVESEKHCMVLQLKGETEDNKVLAPVTVKTKPKCITCGKVNKATSKFCTECGTSLELV